MADPDPSTALSGLLGTLPDLEKAFEPILSKGWNEAVKELQPLERAKLDVLMAYAINDLVWMYLKIKGVDPASHEVSSELERIKTYYGKIKATEEPQSKPTQRVDKAAASRFVSAAIPKSQREAPASTSAQALAKEQAKRAVEEQESIERMGMDHRFRFIAGEAERLSSSDDDEDKDDDDMELGDEAGPQHTFFDDEPEATDPPKEKDFEDEETSEPKSKRRRKRAEDFT